MSNITDSAMSSTSNSEEKVTSAGDKDQQGFSRNTTSSALTALEEAVAKIREHALQNSDESDEASDDDLSKDDFGPSDIVDNNTQNKEVTSEVESVHSSLSEEGNEAPDDSDGNPVAQHKEFSFVMSALQSTVNEILAKEEQERKEQCLEFDDTVEEFHVNKNTDSYDGTSLTEVDENTSSSATNIDIAENKAINEKEQENVPVSDGAQMEITEFTVITETKEVLGDNNVNDKTSVLQKEDAKEPEAVKVSNVMSENLTDTDRSAIVEKEYDQKPESSNKASASNSQESEEKNTTNVNIEHAEKQAKTEEILPPTPGPTPQTQNFDFIPQNEDAIDADRYSENLIALNKINIKNIKQNYLSPRQQEKADEPILRATRHLFNNRFMKAKTIFEKEAGNDPLYATGLGIMAMLKAIMTSDENVTKNAIDVLTTAYSIANAQIDIATNKSVGTSVYKAMTSYTNYFKFTRNTGGLPVSPKPASLKSIRRDGADFIPNGVLRAHVAKAECCLQIAVIQLLQENVMSYIKCGMNLRRAYASYSLVWQEYKRMGQVYNSFIDRDTVSGIQFGIGTVHLILSALPQKILRIVSAFGWKADKHLGFALLSLCVEEKRIRSPLASLVLLAYYTTITTLCPQILSVDYTQPAIETLLDAQKTFPNSAFFLYFAGRTSRLARNLTLSTQSFIYAIDISKKEWAEVEMYNACSYEMAFNYMLEHNWEKAAKLFEILYKNQYWSPSILRYLTAACYDMMGLRTEAILAYAEVPRLAGSKMQSISSIEKYVVNKVNMLQDSGYQDMDMCLNALEFIYVFTGFDFMSHDIIETSLAVVDKALYNLIETEKTEFSIRTCELLPETPPPKYYSQRGALLLLKAALYNAMGEHKEAIIHINWLIDHKSDIDSSSFIVPYAYWEAGVTTWGLDNKTRSLVFWETALKFSKYDFEFRLSMRVNLAITKAEEIAVSKPEPEDPLKRHQLNKKDPIIVLDSIQSRDVSTDNPGRRKNYAPAIRDPLKFNLHI